MEREEVRILKNRIRLYTLKNPASHGFFLSVFLLAGSMYESAEESGITHFLEHVAIRNVNAIMNGELYPMLDRYGMEFNAATYSEMVQFYISGAAPSFGRAIPVVEAMLSPIALSPSEISQERERIKAEIRESDEKSSLTSFTAEAVHAGTNLARGITGTVGAVNRITKKRLEEYRRRVFTPENLFIYITGNYSDDELDRLAEAVGKIELSDGEKHENLAPVCEKFGKRGGEVLVKNGDFTIARFNFDIDMSRVTSAECDLVYEILLSGYASRLFTELSERRGLFYDVSGAIERYRNIGCLYFFYELDRDRLEEAVRLTLDTVRELCEEVLPEEKCMKAGYTDNGYMLLDDPRELNFTFAYDNHVMSSGYDSIDSRAEQYRRITPQRIREVADLIFRPENLTLTVKGKKSKIDAAALGRLATGFRGDNDGYKKD